VIVADLNVVSIAFNEPETYTPLIVDGNRMLPFSFTPKGVESVTGRHLQVVQTNRQVKILKFSRCPLGDIRRKPLRLARGIQFLRKPIRKRLDHPSNVVCHVTHVNARALPHNVFLSRAGPGQDREAPAAFHGVGSKKLLGGVFGYYYVSW
jgi:hypothetical protein